MPPIEKIFCGSRRDAGERKLTRSIFLDKSREISTLEREKYSREREALVRERKSFRD